MLIVQPKIDAEEAIMKMLAAKHILELIVEFKPAVVVFSTYQPCIRQCSLELVKLEATEKTVGWSYQWDNDRSAVEGMKTLQGASWNVFQMGRPSLQKRLAQAFYSSGPALCKHCSSAERDVGTDNVAFMVPAAYLLFARSLISFCYASSYANYFRQADCWYEISAHAILMLFVVGISLKDGLYPQMAL